MSRNATRALSDVTNYSIDTLDSTDFLIGTTAAGVNKRFRASDVPLVGNSFRQRLTAPLTIYVAPGGSDTNSGLTPLEPLQHITTAIFQACREYDFDRQNLFIQLADGTYDSASDSEIPLLTPANSLPASNISSGCQIVGNLTTPSNVVIKGTLYAIGAGTQWYVTGVKMESPGGSLGSCINGHAGGWIRLGKVVFGDFTGTAHIVADYKGTVEMMESYEIEGGAVVSHAVAQHGGQVLCIAPTITVTNTPAFTVFIFATDNSHCSFQSSTITGAATGIRYAAQLNSTISTGGAGANYFPGDVAGFTATGGQYA